MRGPKPFCEIKFVVVKVDRDDRIRSQMRCGSDRGQTHTSNADYRDAIPKPGLASEDGKIIQRLLKENINPQVANHGGHIALVDVQDDTVYIRLEGGCQGCGMADVTLKQGVATEIQRVVPSITSVLDVTDHAGGSNPYYQPGKGGMSPV